jgi:hypothetical protein
MVNALVMDHSASEAGKAATDNAVCPQLSVLRRVLSLIKIEIDGNGTWEKAILANGSRAQKAWCARRQSYRGSRHVAVRRKQL